MSWGSSWGTPFHGGGGTSSLVPTRRHVAIAGMGFMLDTSDGPGWALEDIPVQRAQADTEADPSEATLNTEGLWRRTRQSWHLGAGQQYADRPESSPYRYDTSSGVDPWTRYRLSPLPATDLSLSSATAKHLVVAGTRAFVTDGSAVRVTSDGITWIAITGTPGDVALSIATDGSAVYVAYGAGGVYVIAPGATAATSFATGTASAVAYVKGRLLVVESATADPRVYNVTAAGAITAGNLLLTVPGASFDTGQWASGGPNALYVVAVVGDQTRIWRTAVKQDGTALDVPVIAGELPDGQLGRAIQGYLGSVVTVGATDTGTGEGKVWVLDYADANGSLVVRGSVDTDLTPYAFEPQDRFIWYGGSSGTLNRMDLATNVAEDTSAFIPAHAEDISAGVSGHVHSVVTFGGKRMFTVLGQGVFYESADLVSSGTLETGIIGFGIGDLKNALFADVRHLPLEAGDSVMVEVAEDEGNYVVAGLSTTVGSVSSVANLGQRLAETIRLRVTLSGGATLTMLTVRAVPAPGVGEKLRLRIQMFFRQKDLRGQDFYTNVPAVLDYLRSLRAGRTNVLVQLGSQNIRGIVDRLVRFTPHSEARGDTGDWLGYWNGTLDVDVTRVET